MRLFGIVGWKNSGKTTLTERLVAAISAKGYAVSTIKHAHHAFDIDREGKDSFRHREAGAREVLISSGKRWALMHELRDEDEPPLSNLLGHLSAVDLVLIEGYKNEDHPKIELRRQASSADTPRLYETDKSVVAIAADYAVEETALPQFNLDAVEEIAGFILSQSGLSHGAEE